MFTGIVAEGKMEALKQKGSGMRLLVNMGQLAKEIKEGDSVAVNGVCLTAVELSGETIGFDVMPESLDKTSLGSLKLGERVNVELSLKARDRIGGHFVAGHVDGTGVLEKREGDGEFAKLWIRSPLTEGMVKKGSVALDGVSMTLVDVEKERFSVAVIPKTLELTTLGSKSKGDLINIEVDMLGKYVKKFLPDSTIFHR